MRLHRFVPAIVVLLLAAPPAAGRLSAQTLPPDAQLKQAEGLFDTLNYEAAAAALDQLIATVEPIAAKDPAAAKLLPRAYELRARSRFGLGNTDGATADFRSLLKVAPGYTLAGQVSQRVTKILEDLRKATVGKIMLNLTPVDADLDLDGSPFTAAAGAIPVAAGTHTLTGKRSGCRSASQTFTVTPGATTEVVLTLERISASLALVTAPAGVEVVVDGVSRGRTEAGPIPPQWEEPLAKAGIAAGAASRPFVLDDLPQGAHVVEFTRDCHTKVERSIRIDKPADFRLDPIKLEKAVASVYVDSPTTGASVLLDGESRGAIPTSLDDVCEGSHVVELRSPWGRYLERLTTRAGDKITVQGTVKPAVGLLAVTGLPEGYRGTDLRLGLERAFAAAKTMAVFAPPADRVQQALKAESLAPGWLAFDRFRRPLGAAASAITPQARAELGGKIAKSLEVQGVAELTARPGGDRNQFLLSILAAGSTSPDVLELTVDNPASVTAAVARLDEMPPMYRPSVGVSAVDVLDVAGAVVVGVDAGGAGARAGLVPGDVITKVAEQPVEDGGAFAATVARRKAGEKLTFEARTVAGAVKTGELVVSMAPRLVAMNDQSVLFNNLVLALRARIGPTAATGADPIVRLNLAVGLMRLGDWSGARSELSKVQLAAGPGVSNGTVQYLHGLCSEALGEPAEAERAWRAAATDAESLLTENGPAIKELAERKLTGLRAPGR